MKRPDWLDDDTFELFFLLQKHEVRYLIIGGLAVIYYGYTRNTNDADIFFERTSDNVERLFDCLKEFWGRSIPGIEKKEILLEKGVFFQFGREPNRIDLMNSIPGVDFEKAWPKREVQILETEPPVKLNIISRDELISAKEAAARPIDQADLQYLKSDNYPPI